jgi:hypothetical protein
MVVSSAPCLIATTSASDVWADTGYRSAPNLALLERCDLKLQFQRRSPEEKRSRPIARGHATPSPRARADRTRLRRPEMATWAHCPHHRHGRAPASKSAWPIWPTTSCGWPGSMDEPRLRSRPSAQTPRATALTASAIDRKGASRPAESASKYDQNPVIRGVGDPSHKGSCSCFPTIPVKRFTRSKGSPQAESERSSEHGISQLNHQCGLGCDPAPLGITARQFGLRGTMTFSSPRLIRSA